MARVKEMCDRGFRGLYIPCGETKPGAGWVRADNCSDGELAHSPDVKCDMREVSSHFEKNYFDMVYCCHGIEHLRKNDVVPSLIGMRDVLKKGGILRLAVPNLDSIAKYYQLTKDWKGTCRYLFGNQDNDGQIHHCAYSDESLVVAMMAAGFKKIDRWNPSLLPWRDNSGHYVLVGYGGEDVWNLHTSLNLEGVKE